MSRSRGFRLQAEVLILTGLLVGCGATTSRTTDDFTTTTRVKIALLSDPTVGGLRLDVKTFQGVVTLSGTVKTDADARRAIAIARTINGVREVKSELHIVPRPQGQSYPRGFAPRTPLHALSRSVRVAHSLSLARAALSGSSRPV